MTFLLDKKYLTKALENIFNKDSLAGLNLLDFLKSHISGKSKEDIEKQVFTSNSNHHYDLVVVNNLLEYLPLEYLSIAIKDIFSYSSKHVMIILNFKSDLFKPIIKQLSKYPRHSFYFNS